MIDLTAPIFTDETAARKHLEAVRWPAGCTATSSTCTVTWPSLISVTTTAPALDIGDDQRSVLPHKGAEDTRLTYRRTNQA